jgi:preprotein translocase subunit SecA
VDTEELREAVLRAAREQFERKIESFGEHAEKLEGWILLSVLDDKWKDHLFDLDSLKASISFRGWGQQDPLVEYKKEAYDMFVDLMADMRKTVTNLFFRAQIGQPQPTRAREPQRLQYQGPDGSPDAGAARTAGRGGGGGAVRLDPVGVATTARAGGSDDLSRLQTNRGDARPQTPVSVTAEPGRNDPCPCGSGKKYKKCHGAAG